MIFPPPGSATGRGFTLIEMSIVLAVIGLIVGGVLVGRDMIRLAEVRATIKQIDQFNAAVNTFRNKYNCLPGDCVNAADFGFNAATNGNGDGTIGCNARNLAPCAYWGNGGPFDNTQQTREMVNFWYHLSYAGLISYSLLPYNNSDIHQYAGKVTPPIKMQPRGPGFGATPFNGWAVRAEVRIFRDPTRADIIPGHNFSLSQYAVLYIGASANGFELAMFSPGEMYALDQKMDDGLPMTGNTRAWMYAQMYVADYGYRYNVIAGPAGTASCLTTSTIPMQYNVQYLDNALPGVCSVLMKASF